MRLPAMNRRKSSAISRLKSAGVDLEDIRGRLGISVFTMDDWYFDDETCRKKLKEHFRVCSLAGLGLEDYGCGCIAAGSLLLYLEETQKTDLSNLTAITPYTSRKYLMILDSSTRRNLELCETLREKQKRGSLLWVLDKTKTAMGARCAAEVLSSSLWWRQRKLKKGFLLLRS